MADEVVALAGRQPQWHTEEQRRPFAARAGRGGGLAFTLDNGTEWPGVSRVELVNVLRRFEEIEAAGAKATASDVQHLSRSGSYVLALYHAAKAPGGAQNV